MQKVEKAGGKEKKAGELVVFLQGMVGKKVYIELRNENYVMGILENCDSFMNLRIQNATVIRNATSETVAEYFVGGRNVRFVHFEHNVDAQAVIRRYSKNGNKMQKQKLLAAKRLDKSQCDAGKQIFL